MIIDIEPGLLNSEQIWNLTRNLGDSDYVRSDFQAIWRLLTDQFGQPQLLKYHAWCTLPDVFYVQINKHPRRHWINPAWSIILIDDKSTICIKDIDSRKMKILIADNWSWLQRWARALTSHVIDSVEGRVFQILPDHRLRDAEYLTPDNQMYCELPDINSLAFRTPPDMTGLFRIQFDEAVVEFDLEKKARALKVTVDHQGQKSWEAANLIASKFPRIRTEYCLGDQTIVLNQGWRNQGWVQDAPIFIPPEEIPEHTDPLIWAVEILVQAEKHLQTEEPAQAQDVIDDLTARLTRLNRSLEKGSLRFPFAKLEDDALVVKKHRHCKFCGAAVEQASKLIPSFMAGTYTFFAICEDPLCDEAFQRYVGRIVAQINSAGGQVQPLAILAKTFNRVMSLRGVLIDPIKEWSKKLWKKLTIGYMSRRSAQLHGKPVVETESFAFEPREYKYEQPTISELEEEQPFPFSEQHLRNAIVGWIINFILVLLCLVFAQVNISMQWPRYLLILPVTIWLVLGSYIAHRTYRSLITKHLRLLKTTITSLIFRTFFPVLVGILLLQIIDRLNTGLSSEVVVFTGLMVSNECLMLTYLIKLKKIFAPSDKR